MKSDDLNGQYGYVVISPAGVRKVNKVGQGILGTNLLYLVQNLAGFNQSGQAISAKKEDFPARHFSAINIHYDVIFIAHRTGYDILELEVCHLSRSESACPYFLVCKRMVLGQLPNIFITNHIYAAVPHLANIAISSSSNNTEATVVPIPARSGFAFDASILP